MFLNVRANIVALKEYSVWDLAGRLCMSVVILLFDWAKSVQNRPLTKSAISVPTFLIGPPNVPYQCLSKSATSAPIVICGLRNVPLISVSLYDNAVSRQLGNTVTDGCEGGLAAALMMGTGTGH